MHDYDTCIHIESNEILDIAGDSAENLSGELLFRLTFTR